MKKLRIVAAIVIVLAMIAQIAPMSVLAVGGDYTEKEIHIYRDSMEEDETVTCRFYSDLPEIPYIDFEVFLSVFNKDAVTLEEYGEGCLLATVVRDEEPVYAMIDYENDTITFSNISSFLYSPATEGEAEGEFYYLYMDVVYGEYVDEPAPSSVDLGAYGIDIVEEDGKLFFPVPTLSDLYSSVNQAVVYWNGEVFYYNSVVMDGGAKSQDPAALSILVKNMERSATLANYTYNEICFNIDNFFGFPCTQSPFMDKVQEVGLDKALDEYDPECKQLILAPESEYHIAGIYRLFNFWLCDGGHTGAYMNDLIETLYLDEDDYYRVVGAIRTYGYPDTDYENVYVDYNDSYMDTLYQIYFTKVAVLADEYYIEQGDTAMIEFDEFNIDFAAWEPFLKGETDFPVSEDESDTFLFVLSCLERAKQNPEIKNIVFDLSMNGGGYVAVYIALMSLINGTAEYNLYDRYTGEMVLLDYAADVNLDGVLDEADLNVWQEYSDFNFAVLTSMCSFSCGNMFPSAMKDAGLMVIGEQSGGGTCPLDYNSTAEGLEYITSAGDSMLINANCENIDDGVPVDADLLEYDDEGNKDYSKFFDLELISRLMHEFYGDVVIPGDVDGDGAVTLKDVLMLRQAIAGTADLTEDQLAAADVNGDGAVNLKDVLALRRIVAGGEQ